MSNQIELNDEQLAEVTGGKSTTITDISQLAESLTLQGNSVNANTNVFAIGGGKNSGVEALAKGSVVNTGNTSVSLNSNQA
jgi:bacteriocin-like protein